MGVEVRDQFAHLLDISSANYRQLSAPGLPRSGQLFVQLNQGSLLPVALCLDDGAVAEPASLVIGMLE
jgi:hypothetical protein